MSPEESTRGSGLKNVWEKGGGLIRGWSLTSLNPPTVLHSTGYAKNWTVQSRRYVLMWYSSLPQLSIISGGDVREAPNLKHRVLTDLNHMTSWMWEQVCSSISNEPPTALQQREGALSLLSCMPREASREKLILFIYCRFQVDEEISIKCSYYSRHNTNFSLFLTK